MWTGELCTWWMTTGEEGITSDLMVELWGSSGPGEELGRAGGVGASAAAGELLSTGPF